MILRPNEVGEAIRFEPNGTVEVDCTSCAMPTTTLITYTALAPIADNLSAVARTFDFMSALDEVDGILWTNARHSFVLPEDRRVEAVKDSCKWEFNRSMGVLADRLGDNEYVMGSEFTVPDLILGHCAGWAVNTPGWDLPADKVGDYFKRVRSRPARLMSTPSASVCSVTAWAAGW